MSACVIVDERGKILTLHGSLPGSCLPMIQAITVRYAPPSRIQLLNVATGKITTLVRNAENPQVQP